MDFSSLAKLLVVVGAFLIAVGVLILFLGKAWLPLGRLPGDIQVERPGLSFSFPLMRGIVLSIIITIILNALIWFFRR